MYSGATSPNVKYLVNIRSSDRVKLHSLKVCEFNPMERKYILGRIGLYFGGFGVKAEIILRIWRAK